MRKKMQDTTLDTYDEKMNDGTMGELSNIARQLIEDNPRKTVKELLRIGFEEEIYAAEDRNIIAPRITMLCDDGVIIRPSKRKCEITGNTVLIHELAPESWRKHRQQLYRQHKGPYVKHRMEIQSKSKENIIHTVIWWTDGTVSCTCAEKYHRSKELRCHHAIGMIKAVTGREPGDISLQEQLDKAKERMQHYAAFSTSSPEVAEMYSKWKQTQ